MRSPVSIALRLRAILLLVLLLWLAGGPAWAAPRTAVVGPSKATITSLAHPGPADALHQDACAPPHVGLFRLDLAAAALLPASGFVSSLKVQDTAGYLPTLPAARTTAPWLRLWLRACLSPNAP